MPPQFIVAGDHNILEVTKRLFVATEHQFLVAGDHNIDEVTKRLFVATGHHNLLWPEITTLMKSQIALGVTSFGIINCQVLS